jgi:periplasmic protein TonB
MNPLRLFEALSRALTVKRALPFHRHWLIITPLALGATLGQLWLAQLWVTGPKADEGFSQPPARIAFISFDREEINNPDPPSPSPRPATQEEPTQPQPDEPPLEQERPPEPILTPLSQTVEQPATLKTTPKRDKRPKAAKRPLTPQSIASAPAAQATYDARPLYRQKPSYPLAARRNQIEGYVLVRYTVTRAGDVTSVGVVSASPNGVFEAAALEAVRRWRYPPQPVDRVALQTRIRFVLRGGG